MYFNFIVERLRIGGLGLWSHNSFMIVHHKYKLTQQTYLLGGISKIFPPFEHLPFTFTKIQNYIATIKGLYERS